MPANQTRGVAVAAIAAIVLGFLFFSMFKSVATEKSLRSAKERELSQKLTELAKKDAEIKDLAQAREEAESKLKSSAANVESMVKGYDTKIKELSETVEMLTTDNQTLTRDSEAAKKKIQELGIRIKELEADKYELQNKIKELEAARETMSVQDSGDLYGQEPAPAPRRVEEASAVELGNIVVQKNSGRNAMVQHVDRVYGFIVISAGGKEGVKPGTLFNISRDGQLVTRAVVQRVKEDVSAAVILPEWTQGEVREGDLVSRV